MRSSWKRFTKKGFRKSIEIWCHIGRYRWVCKFRIWNRSWIKRRRRGRDVWRNNWGNFSISILKKKAVWRNYKSLLILFQERSLTLKMTWNLRHSNSEGASMNSDRQMITFWISWKRVENKMWSWRGWMCSISKTRGSHSLLVMIQTRWVLVYLQEIQENYDIFGKFILYSEE